MYHGPLRSTTCSTRATHSLPPPFLPSLARTLACLLTDRRHSRLSSSSHHSPNVLHSLDSLSLLLSLAPARACPPTDRPNDGGRRRYSRPQRFPRSRRALLASPTPPSLPRRAGLAVAPVLAIARPYRGVFADRPS